MTDPTEPTEEGDGKGPTSSTEDDGGNQTDGKGPTLR
jgi:hypothetical protein